MESLVDTAGFTTLSFTPGLLEVLTTPCPLIIGYYKDLFSRSLTLSKWAVYDLVIKHPDNLTDSFLYVESSINAQVGILSRFGLHSKEQSSTSNRRYTETPGHAMAEC